MYRMILLWCFVAMMVASVRASDLTVGPGKTYPRIEDALAAAKAGDTLVVSPLADQQSYIKVALYVDKAKLTIKSAGKEHVSLKGDDFDYSGKGHTPRAIVQFNPGADGCVLEGFELADAHNGSFNGAGVRINQANDVTIRNCDIHDNDMGVMSNGNGTDQTARNQLIESCSIHHNGSEKDPGYNHNLYLGGTSVKLLACEVFSSRTGHNVKSRAHNTLLINCSIHDSANREIDLVDAEGDTTVPGSDALIVGCEIAKDPKCPGNRAVIHFGQDGKHEHDGTLWLANNTIVTPFVAPVVQLSTDKASAKFINNLVYDSGIKQSGQVLVDAGPAGAKAVSGTSNWLSAGFGGDKLSALPLDKTYLGKPGQMLSFKDVTKRDFRLKKSTAEISDAGVPLPEALRKRLGEKLHQYRAPLARDIRPDDGTPDLGAFERADSW